jgi:sugar phosphate isomerase/epimerase
MTTRKLYRPRTMPVAVLSAARQDVVPRDQQRRDPIGSALQSALTWLSDAHELGVHLQLSAALALPDAYVPPEAMLDPVPDHLPVRTLPNGTGHDLSDADAAAIIAACGTDVKIPDLGYFDNLLADDDTIRNQVHSHLLRCGRAAVQLKSVGCDGVTGFIGRDTTLDLDQNLARYEKYVIPLLRELKAMGLKFFVENCPMPGWNTKGLFFNNLAYCVGMWVALIRIAEKHGVGDVLRFTYDPSHDILMGTRPEVTFAVMKAAGYAHYIGRFHGKNMFRKAASVALWTVHGQRVGLGCTVDGQPHPDPAMRGGAWGAMVGEHGMFGVGYYNPVGQVNGTEVDVMGMHCAAREILGVDPDTFYNILEHEFNPARVQDQDVVMELISYSVGFVRGTDLAADSICQSQTWAAGRNIILPGSHNPFYQVPGLAEAVAKLLAA